MNLILSTLFCPGMGTTSSPFIKLKEKNPQLFNLGHFFLLADMSVFLYLVLFCIHCKSKTLQRNFLDSHLLNKANQVPREQSCFLCLSTSAVSSSKQSYSKFLRALQQKYFRSSKQKFPSTRFTSLSALL